VVHLHLAPNIIAFPARGTLLLALPPEKGPPVHTG